MTAEHLYSDRLGALDRASSRLGRLIDELEGINSDLDHLDEMLFVPDLPDEVRRGLLAEMDIAVGAYNHLRDATTESYRQLILLRECCGFRNHDVVRRCFPIPELHEPLQDIVDAAETAG
ncbi:MAG: hypothetical protein H6707_15795 [Deltaproteobacteria bacterium]|nr:hypothetical protein [Deltaproteobacteria bacterium]